jgi:hypothetical protein
MYSPCITIICPSLQKKKNIKAQIADGFKGSISAKNLDLHWKGFRGK